MSSNSISSQRLFIAVEPSILLKPVLSVLTEKLQALAIRGLRVVSPDMIHLTLKFLGNVPERQIQYLRDSMSPLVAFESFCLEFTRIGVFPNLRNAKTIWLGLDEESHNLSELKNAVDQHVTTVEQSKSPRHFVPHLTLARSSRNIEPQEIRQVQIVLQNELSNCQRKLCVGSVSLMRSILDPGGAVYTRIHSQCFKSADES